MTYRSITNYKAKICDISCAEPGKFDLSDELIHVYLLSQCLEHITLWFLHHYTRTDVLYLCSDILQAWNPFLSSPIMSTNLYCHVYFATSLSQQRQRHNSRLHTPPDSLLGDKKTFWQHSGGVWDPHLSFFNRFWTRSRGAHAPRCWHPIPSRSMLKDL